METKLATKMECGVFFKGVSLTVDVLLCSCLRALDYHCMRSAFFSLIGILLCCLAVASHQRPLETSPELWNDKNET